MGVVRSSGGPAVVSGALARILLRYGAGVLIAKGVLPDDFGHSIIDDPDLTNILTTALGALLAVLSEGWYWLAKRFGWST